MSVPTPRADRPGVPAKAERDRLQVALTRAIIDHLAEGVCVLDRDGRVTTLNPAAERLLGRPGAELVGRPLAEAVPDLFAADGAGALQPFLGAVPDRQQPGRVASRLPLACTVVPIIMDGEGAGAVLVFHDLTEHQRAERAEGAARAQAARAEQLERELRALEQVASLSHSPVSAQLYGIVPLREAAPAVFAELLRQYGELLDLALDQRAYRVEHNLPDRLRGLADQLSFLNAGPRDVIDVHSATLKHKCHDVPVARSQAYVAEGRLLVLELMGHVLASYRTRALGTPAGPAGRGPGSDQP
jgi:PAS domain S-box-containing protein